jgi:hypothetical protein
MRNEYNICVENPEGILEDLRLTGRIILKWIRNK